MDEIYSDSSKRGPGDFDTWDAPLRRKKEGEAQVIMRRNKRTRDQGVQTGVASSVSSSNQSVLGQTTSASPHIQMPYRRELLDNQPKMMKKPAPRPMAVSASTVSISINNLLCIFCYMRNLAKNMYMQQSKNLIQYNNNWLRFNIKIPQSSSPAEASSDLPRRNVSAMRGEFETKNGYGNQRGAPRSPSGHIKELKSLGKEMSGEEEGTFNFQVRKTYWGRWSWGFADVTS